MKYLSTLLLAFVLFSCSEEKEILDVAPLADYLPLVVGKSITYRLDSTIFTQGGTATEVHKYQVKHTVVQETAGTDMQKTYLVQRTINNENASGSWVSNGNYFITAYPNKVEVLSDNLRVVALQAPLQKDFTWKGNSQLPLNPYTQLFNMDAGSDMNKWDFTYTSFGAENYEGQQYADTWTVLQRNETLNIPPTANTSYGFKEVSSEKYAKGIGLVYKNFHLVEFQGPSADNPSPHYTGFGITMWMISHN